MTSLFAAAVGAQPNIVIIVADDLGIGEMGTYGPNIPGSDPAFTPILDKLAAGGVQFNQAWSNPLCSPTRATILTGRYGAHTGVGMPLDNVQTNADGELHASETTLSEVLVTAPTPYAGSIIGKWHLGKFDGGDRAPLDIGGFQYHSGVVIGEITDYKNWERFEDGISQGFEQTYATTKNVDDALDWISTQTGPWLLYLAFNAPHEPFHVPPKNLLSKRTKKTLQQLGIQTMTDCDLNNVNRRLCYKAATEAMDQEIGRLFRLGGLTSENTVVIFLGDNGTPQDVVAPDIFPPGKNKGTVYEGGVLVPLIIGGPPEIVASPNREVNHPVNISDVFATVLEIASATVPAGTDSISLMPYLLDPLAAQQRTYVYTEKFDGGVGVHFDPDGSAAAFNGVYKVIEGILPGGGGVGDMLACFDLVRDEFELCDLHHQPLDPVLCPHATGIEPSECRSLYDTMELDLH